MQELKQKPKTKNRPSLRLRLKQEEGGGLLVVTVNPNVRESDLCKIFHQKMDMKSANKSRIDGNVKIRQTKKQPQRQTQTRL